MIRDYLTSYMKSSLKLQATQLRKKGQLYSEIAKELGIAKSTAHLWTKDVQLSSSEARQLAHRYSETLHLNIEKMAANKRIKRIKQESLILKEAIGIANNADLSTNNKKIICACLFWCEGAKNIDSGVRFINSDPVMIGTFLKLLRDSFILDEAKFRALVHLHEYHDATEQQLYWSEVTQIPLEQFNQPYLKPHTGINKHEGYPGCISIRYGDSALGKLLKMIYIEFSKKV